MFLSLYWVGQYEVEEGNRNVDMLGEFERWATRRMRDEMAPASRIVILSGLTSLEELANPGDAGVENLMKLQYPAWGHLHRFFQIVESAVGDIGKYVTYWNMGFAIVSVASGMGKEFGFIHPVFRESPPPSIWSGVYLDYWEAMIFGGKSYDDLSREYHNILRNGLREVQSVDADNCGGHCGVVKCSQANCDCHSAGGGGWDNVANAEGEISG
jgi:hypothetical protein